MGEKKKIKMSSSHEFGSQYGQLGTHSSLKQYLLFVKQSSTWEMEEIFSTVIRTLKRREFPELGELKTDSSSGIIVKRKYDRFLSFAILNDFHNLLISFYYSTITLLQH